MSSSTGNLDKELQILFGALCDGIRQEVRARWFARKMIPAQFDVSLARVREQEVASCLYFQLRSAGFFVQTESYFATGDQRSRPDFRIWLPETGQYVYLELKTYGWGSGASYDYERVWKGIEEDLDKVRTRDLPNGLIVVGFSQFDERRTDKRLSEAFEELSDKIGKSYPYQPVDHIQQIDLRAMDDKTGYAMVGLWVRKS